MLLRVQNFHPTQYFNKSKESKKLKRQTHSNCYKTIKFILGIWFIRNWRPNHQKARFLSSVCAVFMVYQLYQILCILGCRALCNKPSMKVGSAFNTKELKFIVGTWFIGNWCPNHQKALFWVRYVQFWWSTNYTRFLVFWGVALHVTNPP